MYGDFAMDDLRKGVSQTVSFLLRRIKLENVAIHCFWKNPKSTIGNKLLTTISNRTNENLIDHYIVENYQLNFIRHYDAQLRCDENMMIFVAPCCQ